VSWLRRLAACLPTRRPGFDPGSVHVGFVVNKVALGQVFSPSTSVFPCQFHSTGAPLLGKGQKNKGKSSGDKNGVRECWLLAKNGFCWQDFCVSVTHTTRNSKVVPKHTMTNAHTAASQCSTFTLNLVFLHIN
jgi:hypothetical protein